MALQVYKAAYAPESWAAQLNDPRNRAEAVRRAAFKAAGGKLVGGWLCFGEYELVSDADAPNNESMAAIALAVVAGGAIQDNGVDDRSRGDRGAEEGRGDCQGLPPCALSNSARFRDLNKAVVTP